MYGETDGGGAQVLYLSHVPFEKLGLPVLGDAPAPSKARNVQRSVYHNFIAPLVLYGVLGAVTWRKAMRALAVVFGIGAIAMLWRLVAGLGPTTALNDGSIAQSWYDGDWRRHPYDEDTVPKYTTFQPDGKRLSAGRPWPFWSALPDTPASSGQAASRSAEAPAASPASRHGVHRHLKERPDGR